MNLSVGELWRLAGDVAIGGACYGVLLLIGLLGARLRR